MSDAAQDIRTARLPKWAQQRIATLERNVERLQAKLAEGPSDSDTFAGPYGTPRPLGRGTSIVFTGGGLASTSSTDRVTVRRQGDGSLYVMCDESAVVLPRASNAFVVVAERRR